MDTVCLTSKSTDSRCKKNCVVKCQDGRGAGSGFVREREAAETCHYPQRGGGGGDEATLKYEGCISTNEWTDNKVTFKRGGQLLFSTRLDSAADLETEGGREAGEPNQTLSSNIPQPSSSRLKVATADASSH